MDQAFPLITGPDGWTAAFIDAAKRAGVMDAAALDRAARLARQSGERIDKVALQLGLVPDHTLARLYATLLGRPLLGAEDLAAALVDSPDVPHLPPRFLRHNRLIPLVATPTQMHVAMADPFDERALRALEFATGKLPVAQAAVPAALDAALDRLCSETQGNDTPLGAHLDEAGETDLDRLRDMASEAPVIRLVNQMIVRAVEARASDIHVEATDGGIRVRTRIDGVLRDMTPPAAALRAAIVSRIKIMAKLDIAERRLAQDGRIRLPVRGRDIDFRVSTTPSVHGESVVLRILDRGQLKLDFAALGFDRAALDPFVSVLRRPNGIVLVTGPTGSGKTTTLYTALSLLNAPETKILTVEDPVEYLLPGINQVQVKPQIGLTFASALRSFLRQDPDIMMIGEIRDLETAQIAVQAALTGHLVLSTVHTNDSASAVTRLLDMGLEDYLLTSTINAIAAQRLVRTLCVHCKQAYDAPEDLLRRLGTGVPHATLFRARGCESCGLTGFAGRTTIVEVLTMTEAIRKLVLRHAEAGEIRGTAVAEGMRGMHQHGMEKVLSGITTFEEVARAVHDA